MVKYKTELKAQIVHEYLSTAHKRNFTADFKLSVINYYQTHEDSMAEEATRFDILSLQVST